MGLKLGIDDPEQWLEDCPDRVSENWDAYFAVEPFGGERELLARAVSLLYVLCFTHAKPEHVMADSDRIMQQLMPSEWVGQPEPVTADQDMERIEKHLASKYG